jgi:hypothetical protein
MNDMLCRQVITSGNFSLSRFASIQGTALLKKIGACGLVYGTVYPTASEK